jgi:hypothetical protein
MCDFFSAIVFKSGDIRFCESDSHETLIARLQLDDTVSTYHRPWVRVECKGDEHDDVSVDEAYCPSWVTADRDEFNERVVRTRARLLPLYEARQRDLREAEERCNKEYAEIEARHDALHAAHTALAEWPENDDAPGNAHDEILRMAVQLRRLEFRELQQRTALARTTPYATYVARMRSFFGYTPEPETPTVDEPEIVYAAPDPDDGTFEP